MMRMPIKMGRDVLPRWCSRMLPTTPNPGALVWEGRTALSEPGVAVRAWFSKHVSGLTSGVTWKSTTPHRHMLADAMLLDICCGLRPVIIDIGVSDGITSLELIEKLAGNFEKFFVTDRALDLSYVEDDGRVYFYEGAGECTVMSTKRLVVYGDPMAWVPFTWIAKRLLGGAPRCVAPRAKKLRLLQPALCKMATEDSRIILREYDVFSKWPGPVADIVKVANLLNLDYFDEVQIRSALTNIGEAVEDGGRLMVVDNPEEGGERVSVFRKSSGKLCLDREINDGCQVRDILLSM